MSATEALEERDQVLAEVELKHREAIDAGMDVLRDWAQRGRPFSANDVRNELRAAGLGRYSIGALFVAAEKARIIRPVGVITSSDRGTHGKKVARWIGGEQRTPLEALVVPVRRSSAGRFSDTNADPGTPALFDIDGESR